MAQSIGTRQHVLQGTFTALMFAWVLTSGLGCRLYDLALWRPARFSGTEECPVEKVKGVTYHDGPDAHAKHHQLDLFLPQGRKDYPVVVLVHGGVWMWGDKHCYGLYAAVGENLARQGIGVVMPNYRLSPAVKHPAHVQDVARAVAWTRRYIATYGGNPDQLFVAGHSAGGHLAALLATDPTYLAAEGLKVTDLKGVITSSGVYRIPLHAMDVTLGGASPSAFWLDQVVPPRSAKSWSWARLAPLPGIPVCVDLFRPAFAADPQLRVQASPLYHVRPGLPPFLILVAGNDLPTLDNMAQEFHDALARQKVPVHLLRIPHRNHCSVLFRAIDRDDPVAQALVQFVQDCCDP